MGAAQGASCSENTLPTDTFSQQETLDYNKPTDIDRRLKN